MFAKTLVQDVIVDILDISYVHIIFELCDHLAIIFLCGSCQVSDTTLNRIFFKVQFPLSIFLPFFKAWLQSPRM